ncbi:MAG: DUF2497 domain-containing protein [Wolbachia endosymbiont of Tyrophagus putrescentiae]|nr:DUF2497 domain-containing protein [Wolbachia endosymbiont of Tyrophagus putrescentiae]
MYDEQNNHSVRDILEDIKKAISGKGSSNSKNNDGEEDILPLKEEYLPESEDEEDDAENSEENVNSEEQAEDMIYDAILSNQDSKTEEKVESQSYEVEEKVESNDRLYSTKGNDMGNDHLILKENIEEIRVLLGKMQSELQQKQQPKPTLTVEELVVSLLKPELSEWLNKHLHKLVKEIVERELKDIINNK